MVINNKETEEIIKQLGWPKMEENGVLVSTKHRADLISTQTITVTRKNSDCALEWVERNNDSGESRALFSFKVKNNELVETSPNLVTEEHFAALLARVAQSQKLMGKVPDFLSTGMVKQESLTSNLSQHRHNVSQVKF